VACRLKARISESERTSIARQRLGNHVFCIIVCVTSKHVHVATRTWHIVTTENESINSGIPSITDTLSAVVSENKKLKGPTRCSLFGLQRTLLRGLLTEIWDRYSQTVDDFRVEVQETEQQPSECYHYSDLSSVIVTVRFESVIINCNPAWLISSKSSVKSRTHKLFVAYATICIQAIVIVTPDHVDLLLLMMVK
jgi:hypothetical protein